MQGIHTELIGKAGHIIQALDSIRSSLGKDADLSFPQIIVLGSEKSGKSTLLERIAMLEFFPRGEGICTRMPIKLQLQHMSQTELKEFCSQNSLVYSENNAWVRLKYQAEGSDPIVSPRFYTLDEVATEVKSYMDQAVAVKKGSNTFFKQILILIQTKEFGV